MNKFEVGGKNKLDNPERRKMLPPRETLIKLGLSDSNKFCDIGAGIGYFSLPAAEIVGQNGKVFAIDISADMLAIIKEKQAEYSVKNIELVESKEYDLNITDGAANFAFMCNVLHEIDDKKRFLVEINRILENSGALAIIEWNENRQNFGPQLEERILVKELTAILIDAGFEVQAEYKFSDYFYGIKAVKL
jgi:FkbM family methyltransferase